MPEYAQPDVLVSTAWVAEHLSDPAVRIVESDEDRALYTQGHIPGAVEIDWAVDLQCPVVRDYIDRSAFDFGGLTPVSDTEHFLLADMAKPELELKG